MAMPIDDWKTAGGVLGALASLVVGAWGWTQKQRANVASTTAEVAGARADATKADAENALYQLMVERVKALEQRQSEMEGQLRAEKEETEKLRTRVAVLIRWIRVQGLTPPEESEE